MTDIMLYSDGGLYGHFHVDFHIALCTYIGHLSGHRVAYSCRSLTNYLRKVLVVKVKEWTNIEQLDINEA